MPSHSSASPRRGPGRPLLVGVVIVALVAAGLLILKSTGVLFRDPTAASAPASETLPPAAPAPSEIASPAPVSAVLPAAPAAGGLQAGFDAFNQTISAPIGIAVLPIGGGSPITLGPWTSGAAWSTSKVPLSIAALRADPPASSGVVSGAITASDNASAESLWSGLGAPDVAATKVEAVLREAGDQTAVSSQRSAGPEFSAFGQTQWPLVNQTQFMAFAACSHDPSTTRVLELMGQISGDQSWGLGGISGTRFKGGWGPNSGGYLVRQLGIIDQGGQMTAVAIAAQSGSFGQGTSDLNAIAEFLNKHLTDLPKGTCAPA